MKLLLFNVLLCLVLAYPSLAQRLPGGLGNAAGRMGGFGGQNSSGSSNRTDQNPSDDTKPTKKGKILDDSTKQIYGPNSVRYFLEEDIFNNRSIAYKIDTLTTHFQHFNFIQRSQNQMQDLGNMGTAARTLYFQPVAELGVQTGYYVFDLYSKKSEEIRYFDTKSPFTDMYYASGGRGENMLRFDFNRNINPRWNAGLQLQTFNSRKQFGSLGSVGTQAVKHWNAVGHSSYFSKDSSYILLANYNYTNHTSNDDGGVIITDDTNGGIASEDPMLTNVQSEEKKKQLHSYQQYALGNGLQLYHILDIKRQDNSFTDKDISLGKEYNIYRTINAIDTFNTSLPGEALFRKYRLIQNKIGVKGFYKGFNYRLHFKRRDYKLSDSLDNELLGNSKIKRHENLLGAWFNYYFKDSTRAFVQAEYLIGADYNLRVEYSRKVVNFGLYQVSSSPGLMQQGFYSNVGTWSNKFENQFSNTFYSKLFFKYKNTSLSPQASYSIINNYLYFDSLYMPRQERKIISFLLAGLSQSTRYKKLYTENQIFIAAHTGPNRLRYPNLMINSRVSYDFKYSKLELTTGLDLHYKSAYYAYAYQPATQQFYVQDNIKVKPGLLADAFVTTKLNRVRLMLKYSQLNHLVLGDYYVGPNFKGLKGALSFAVDWPLFD